MPDMHSVDDTSVLTAVNSTMDSNVYHQHDDGQDRSYVGEPSETSNSTPDAKRSTADGWQPTAAMKTEPAPEQPDSGRLQADSSCTVKVESDACSVRSGASPAYDKSYGFGGALEASSYLQPLPSLASLALSPASSFHNRLISATASSDAGTTTPSCGFPMTPPSRSPAERSFGLHDVYYCHLCTFVGSNKSEFDEHMATHFEHQCPNCDYTSRTEGRLRRHIKDFHSNPDETTTRREQGKPKTMRCRQCNYSTQDKYEFWNHQRNHIKDDKMLQCPKCPFVTEYKHHLEYHLRNHFGSKPYKCDRCNYSCVNKSMLNSHMKSHTNVYQYRCADCTYATKYCHSLKLHLKKYSHKPATVLNPDGSLPTDGSGDFELVSKRGPPRGPRGPRKDRSPPPGFTPSLGPAGACQMPLPGLLAGMPNGVWPPMMAPRSLFAAGFPHHQPPPPPPLIPVPGMSPLCLQMPSPMEALRQLDNGADDGQSLYRRYQDFLYAASQQDVHYKKLNAEMSRRMMSSALAVASSQAAEPPKSSPSVSPQVAPPDDSHKKALVADLAACIEAEARECGECPLDLTNPCRRGEQLQQQQQQPHADDGVIQHKRKPGDDGAWSSDGDQTEQRSRDGASPRKRSRKGKAYKLDTLCLKLQEKRVGSPPEGYESDDYGSEFDDSSPGDRQRQTGGGDPEDDDPEDDLERLERKLTTLGDGAQIRTANGGGGGGGRDKEEEKDSGNEDHNSTDNSEPVKGAAAAADDQKLSPDAGPQRHRPDVPDPDSRRLVHATALDDDDDGDGVCPQRDGGPRLGRFECCHCGIVFRDCIMYTVHMGYHGYDDPFKCNMCGHEAENRFQFFLHIARAAHN